MKKQPTVTTPAVSISDLNTRQAAKAFTARAIKSQATARQVSIDEGIHTKSAKLTKRYSSLQGASSKGEGSRTEHDHHH